MVPILSIVGKSDSGKTTLIERLIPELTRRGYRVATVKHDLHGFDIDREGKDTWRHKQAGAHTVIISSPNKLALIRETDRDHSLDDIRRAFVRDVDIIISEGYKNDTQPKIEVSRAAQQQELLCDPRDNLVAIASDRSHDRGVPCFDINDAAGLADFIVKRFLLERALPKVALRVDGADISLTPFVQNFMLGTITGMIGALRGVGSPRQVEILVDRGVEPAKRG